MPIVMLAIAHHHFPCRRGESTSRQVECLLDALNAFVKSSAGDCRGQVCRLGESLFPLFLQIWKKNPLVKVHVYVVNKCYSKELSNMMIVKNYCILCYIRKHPATKHMLKAVFLQLNRNRTSTSCWCNDDGSKGNIHFDAPRKQVFFIQCFRKEIEIMLYVAYFY